MKESLVAKKIERLNLSKKDIVEMAAYYLGDGDVLDLATRILEEHAVDLENNKPQDFVYANRLRGALQHLDTAKTILEAD